MGNLTENKLNVTLTAATITAITTNVNAIAAALPAGSLDESQRASYNAIDVNNKVFAEDVLKELTVSGAGIIPPFISSVFMQNDLTLFDQLDTIAAMIDNLAQKISDIKRISGHEAYTTALTVYRIYDAANIAAIPGAKQAYDKLKERFDAQGRPAETKA